jgi:hypothetical protein
MKVLTYRLPHVGAAQVFQQPGSDHETLPPTAHVPGGPFPRAMAQAGSQGHQIPWDDWCDRLSEQLPYFDGWSVEDVPDGISPDTALSLIRQRDADKFFGS